MLEDLYGYMILFGGIILAFKILMMMFGFDGEFDSELDTDSDDAFRYLSISSISTFCLIFGLVGLSALKELNLSPMVSSLMGVSAGVISSYFVFLMLELMKKLDHSGADTSLEQYIGKKGTVSVNVKGYSGKVIIKGLSGSREISAMPEEDIEIRRDSLITVTAVVGDKLVVKSY